MNWDRWYDPWGIGSTIFHAATGIPTAQEKRAQANLIGSQVNAYKKQTEMAEKEIASKRDQQMVEKRRINDKQVKALRHRFAPSGFLDSSDAGDFADTLGA